MTPSVQDTTLDYARLLALSVLEARGRVAGGTADARERRLADAELPSLMVYAGVLVRVEPAQVRAIERDLKTPTEHTKLSWKALHKSLKCDAESPPRIPADRAFDIVERYVRPDPAISVRARYNVACFYACLAADDDDPVKTKSTSISKKARVRAANRALAELDLALNDATLVQWAEVDPSLQALRADWRADWDEIIVRHRFKQAEEPPGSKTPDPPADQRAK